MGWPDEGKDAYLDLLRRYLKARRESQALADVVAGDDEVGAAPDGD